MRARVIRGSRGSAALRLLGIFALLAGLLVMHGLTGGHDMSMAVMTGSGSPEANAAASVPTGPSPAAAMATTDSVVSLRAPGSDPGHDMGPVCLAILTGLLVLLLVLLRLRGAHPTSRPAACAVQRIGRGRAPPPQPYLRPSLSKLRVARI